MPSKPRLGLFTSDVNDKANKLVKHFPGIEVWHFGGHLKSKTERTKREKNLDEIIGDLDGFVIDFNWPSEAVQHFGLVRAVKLCHLAAQRSKTKQDIKIVVNANDAEPKQQRWYYDEINDRFQCGPDGKKVPRLVGSVSGLDDIAPLFKKGGAFTEKGNPKFIKGSEPVDVQESLHDLMRHVPVRRTVGAAAAGYSPKEYKKRAEKENFPISISAVSNGATVAKPNLKVYGHVPKQFGFTGFARWLKEMGCMPWVEDFIRRNDELFTEDMSWLPKELSGRP